MPDPRVLAIYKEFSNNSLLVDYKSDLASFQICFKRVH